jgi:site-specific DNA-cytosine methylase
MASGELRPAPIWDDLRTFDGRPWRGVVDCVSGGYPCQPFSQAGSQRGAGDERHLWPHFARIIDEVEPAVCFLENVRGHVRLGLRDVWSDLRRRGYEVRFGVFSAEEVGAPHRRERVFTLAAHPDSGGLSSLWQSHERPQQRARGDEPDGCARATHWRTGARPESLVRRVDDGVANWVDRLRATGNGVVPQQAALAWSELSRQLSPSDKSM